MWPARKSGGPARVGAASTARTVAVSLKSFRVNWWNLPCASSLPPRTTAGQKVPSAATARNLCRTARAARTTLEVATAALREIECRRIRESPRDVKRKSRRQSRGILGPLPAERRRDHNRQLADDHVADVHDVNEYDEIGQIAVPHDGPRFRSRGAERRPIPFIR